MTLDVEMPGMDGLEFLEKVMRLRPFPVIMISSLTARGAFATIKAMEIGAIDCVGKPSPTQPNTFDDLVSKVRAAAGARPQLGVTLETANLDARSGQYISDGKLVAIGASTGGVEAIIEILSHYPANCPPTVITLHMPSPFTKSFANRLDTLCAANVAEAYDGAPIRSGLVYLAPGSATHLEVSAARDMRCQLRQGELVSGHRPSVDMLFTSVSRACRHNAVGIILTGMGRDGATGLLAMRRAGAKTIGQDEATSVIYGMPRVACEIDAVEKSVSLAKIAGEILNLTSKSLGKV